jgi:hypothetical protein
MAIKLFKEYHTLEEDEIIDQMVPKEGE